jgi:amino acid transporter
MQQYRLPARSLASAFVLVQTAVMVAVLLVYEVSDFWTALRVGAKVFGTTAVLLAVWNLFRRRLWRYSVFRHLGLVEFPDLNGTWVGALRYEGRDKDIPARVEIRQTYTSISFTYHGVLSESYSIAATLAWSAGEDGNFQLIVTYQNVRIRKVTGEDLAAGYKEHRDHRGTVVLNVVGDPATRLEGKMWSENLSVDPAAPHETSGYLYLEKQPTSRDAAS